MEDGKKKIWLCLIVVVLAAVVIGLLYELSTSRGQAGEGFLIENSRQRAAACPVYQENTDAAVVRTGACGNGI